MKTLLIENQSGSQKVYDSLILGPESLSIFSSELAVKIISEIAKQPACAMDIAKTLKQHEQKIYYHLRKMRDAGIVRQVGTEPRYGMTAKMFELVSPVIATKLSEDGYTIKGTPQIVNPDIEKFLDPFVKDGKLNAKIIMGEPYSHGPYDASSTEGPHAFDFGVFLGRFLNAVNFPTYILDTDAKENDLKNNLILFGNTRTNIVINKINDSLPIYFDPKSGALIDKNANTKYDDPRVGVIGKFHSPFNKNRRVLLFGGVRTRGVQAAIIAFTRYFNTVIKDSDPFFKIVKGFDKDGDKVIDSIEEVE